jgi:two-component system sensor histidine kinase/response regulator
MVMIEQQARNGLAYDVAIVDMLMPGKDGLQFAKEMKVHPVGSLVRLVILTSLIQRGHAELARQAGFVAYLTKPARHDQLSNCLKIVLGLPGLMDEAPVTTEITPAPPLITRHTIAETGSAARILVAEDNLINQKLAVRMLEKLGYQSDVVGNGQEALAALERVSYAMVLMDCQMPLVDGLEATRLIRENERRQSSIVNGQSMPSSHIPIVALTANAMSGDRDCCLAAGMDDFLTKPVRKNNLKEALERWIPLSIRPQATHACGAEHRTDDTGAETLPNVFDVATMLRNIGGDTGLLEELVELFVQRHQTMLEAIRAALANTDQVAVEQAAHTLKGTAGNLCASEVVLYAGQLEAIGRLGTLVEGPMVYAQLDKAVLRLVRHLKERSRKHTETRECAA